MPYVFFPLKVEQKERSTNECKTEVESKNLSAEMMKSYIMDE
jgi:hypothetical protein